VTLVGADKLPPLILMQSLAAVYGLNCFNRPENLSRNTWVLTDAPGLAPPPRSAPRIEQMRYLFYDYHRYMSSIMPSPIHRALEVRLRAAHLNMDPTSWLEYRAQFEYQTMAAQMRNMAVRMFRYLAEPQVKAQPKGKLALSRLGERERTLLTLAQTAAAYGDVCQVADTPPPPYINDIAVYTEKYASLEGGTYLDPNGNPRFSLAVLLADPYTGLRMNPVTFFDAPLER